MLELIYGPPGSGKTSATLERLISHLEIGLEGVVLVPEQQVVTMEGLLAEKTEGLGRKTLGLEVLSFRRLANYVFRLFGGLCHRYASEGGQMLLLWQVLQDLAPTLTEYRGLRLSDRSVTAAMLSEIRRLQRAAVSPSDLEAAADALQAKGYEKLGRKLRDISSLYAGYRILFAARGEDAGDPEDDLSRLCPILERQEVKAFFAEKQIFVDGFSDLTGQEYEVLRRLLESGAFLTVTVAKRPGDDREFFSKVTAFEGTLCRIARRLGTEIRRTVLPDGVRRAPILSYLERNFQKALSEPCPKENTQALTLLPCDSPYEEAEAAAQAVLADVQKGGRFRDHAVVVRDTDRYAGILQSVFSRYGIPCFFSVRGNLLGRSAVRAILTALELKRGNFRTEDFLTYLKTGFSGITADEVFALEEYITTWSVRGRRFYDETGFTMNPSGYSERFTDEDAALLASLNRSRETVVRPLLRFFAVFDGKAATGRSVTEALYRFLLDIGLDRRLKEDAVLARQSGRDRDAEELAQLWNAISDSLDEIHAMVGDRPCTPVLYIQWLQTVFSVRDIGSIPTSVDEVVFSDALLFRGNRIRHMHLLGVSDGVFPAAVGDHGIFGDADLRLLEDVGLTLGGDTCRLAEEELHTFYLVLSIPSETLSVSFSTFDLQGGVQEPSTAFLELCHLLERDAKSLPRYADLPLLDRLYSREASLSLVISSMASESSDPTAAALLAYYREDPARQAFLDGILAGIHTDKERLSEAVTEAFYGDQVYLTQSRIESFVRCPFAYTLKYLLKLGEEKSSSVKASDVGTLMHMLLERFLRRLKEEDRLKSGVSDAEIRALTEDLLAQYQKSVCGDSSPDVRLKQLLRRLKKTAELLLTDLREEFSQSRFTPVCFELPVGSGEEKDQIKLPPVRFSLENGREAVLCGVIDRVDAMKQGKDVFLRVVDYKTGLKELKLENLDLGLDLQMLLYMMALCSSDSAALRDRTGLEPGGRYRAAGVLYYAARRPQIVLEQTDEEANVFQKAKESLGRNGLLLKDEEVLSAMDEALAGRFIPVARSTKGELKGLRRSHLQEEAALQTLLEGLPPKVTELAEKIRCGIADATPLKEGGHDGCRYCEMYAVCRKKETVPEEEGGDSEE